jgi:MFS family permease
MRAVLRSPELRRAQAGFAGFNLAEQGVWVALLVYAFERGGASEAGLVAIVQLVPAAIAAPFLGTLADRSPPTRVQTAGYAIQAVAYTATAAVMLADGPALVVYVFGAVAATVLTVTRPTHAVLTPVLSRSPTELTAAMVTSGWIENASVLAAPALAGVLLAVSDPGTVLVASAAVVGLGAVLVAPLRATDPDPRRSGTDDLAKSGMREMRDGFKALSEHREARLLVGFIGLEHIGWGAVDLLAVILALDVLDIGSGGAGYLQAVFGLGGLLGIAGAVLLIGGRRLAPAVLGGALTWGVALVILGLAPTTAAAFALFTVAGASRAVLDVGARTLLLRTARPDVLCRVFGIAEGLAMLGLAIGSVLVPVLDALGGAEAALIGVGIVVALLAIVRTREVLTVDAAAKVPVVELALLRRLPIFGPLPNTELEGLANALEPVEAGAGTVIVRQGDEGDRYYAVASGEVEIVRDGECAAVLGRGEGFGEIALLHDVPRTATVKARSDVLLYALGREPFSVALTGHAPTASMAEAIADEREQTTADTLRLRTAEAEDEGHAAPAG